MEMLMRRNQQDSPYLSNRQMVKTDSEYLRLAVKTCQKKNDSSPITNKVFFSNWVRRILLSEMQSLKVFLQVFLCNTKQNQTSGKGQELTLNKEGNTHRHTHNLGHGTCHLGKLGQTGWWVENP